VEISPEHKRILSGAARGPLAALLRGLLWIASLPYGLVVRARNILYDNGLLAEYRADRPVVSIGNITTGGTGKTPAVEFAARWFLERGARPAILSRGYRSRAGRNDEAMLLAAHLPDIPHYQDPNRFRAAVEATKVGDANVLVLDDGLQHRRLTRFAEVVLVDATCPFGYGHLLPRGLLREPINGLRRADLIVLTRGDLISEDELTVLMERLDRIAPDVPKATASHQPTGVARFPDGAPEPPGTLSGRRVGLFCSIGNPDAFRQTVEGLGARVEWAATFPDHHWYTTEDLAGIVRAEHRPVEVFVTTEKDAVKLLEFCTEGGEPVWPKDKPLMVLRIEMAIRSGAAELEALFEEALQAAQYDEG